MSFLGKFFNAKQPDQRPEGENQDEGPPIPKKAEAAPQGGTPFPKKFQRPVVPPKPDPETQPRQETNNGNEQEESNQGQNVSETALPESRDESANQSGLNMSTISGTADNKVAPAKPMSFLEKMKLKREQEEAAKLQESMTVDPQQENQDETNEDENGNQPEQSQPATNGPPKFKFMVPKAQKAKLDESAQNTSQNQSQEHETSRQEDSTQQPKSRLPFKFLNSKQNNSRAEAQEDTQHQNEENPDDAPNYDALDQPSRILAQETASPKPRLGFLKKYAQEEKDQDASGDNPNDTLNLTPVEREKSFLQKEDLADALDRADSGRNSPKPVEKDSRMKPEVFDIEAHFNSMKQQEARLKQELFSSIRLQNAKKRQITILEKKLKEVEEKRRRVEKDQENAIAEENYILADELETERTTLANELDRLKSQITDVGLEVDELESETIRLGSLEYTTLKKQDAGLNKLLREIDDFKGGYEQKEGTRIKRERGFLEDEKEQLKISKEHIDVNLKHVEDERDSTEKGIERQTKDSQQERDRLALRKETLEKEIQDLRELLEKKEAEQETVSQELELVNEKIDVVRNKFKKQLEKVNRKKEKVMEEVQVYESEMSVVEKRLQDISKEESVMSKAMEQYNSQKEEIKKARDSIQKLIAKIDSDNKEKEKANSFMVEKRDNHYEELHNLRTLEEKSNQSSTILKKLECDIETAEAEMKNLSDKIPLLEKEKKVAATARNFLEANKISKEIKEVKDQIEEFDSKVQELKRERVELTESIPQRSKQLEEMNERIAKSKKEYEISIYKVLDFRIKDLENIESFFDKNRDFNDAVTLDEIEIELSECRKRQQEIFELYKSELGVVAEPEQMDQPPDKPSISPAQDSSLTEQDDVNKNKSTSQDGQDEHAEEELANAEKTSNPGDETIDHETVQPSESIQEETAPVPTEEELNEKIANLNEQLDALVEEYTKTEADIEQAAEDENYELADELNTANNQRKEQRDELESQIKALQDQLQAISN